MMLQNRFTRLYLLFDLSVGARDLNTGIQLRLPPSLFRCSKANLDRCSSRGGDYAAGSEIQASVNRERPGAGNGIGLLKRARRIGCRHLTEVLIIDIQRYRI